MDLARLQTPPLHQTCLQKSDLHRVRHNPAAARQLANPLMVNSGKREMRPFLLLIIIYWKLRSLEDQLSVAQSQSAEKPNLQLPTQRSLFADFSNTTVQFALSFSQKCISRLVLHFLKTTECKNAYLGVFKSLQTS